MKKPAVLTVVGLALVCAMPVAAQYDPPPPGFRVCREQNCNTVVLEGAWVELGGSNTTVNNTFYLDFSQSDQEACIDIEFSFGHDGYTTAGFFRGPAGVHITVDRNQWNTTGQVIEAAGFYGVAPEGTFHNFQIRSPGNDALGGTHWIRKVEHPNEQHYYAMTTSGTGQMRVCVSSSDRTRPAYVAVVSRDTSYYVGDGEVSMRWHVPLPPTPTPAPTPLPTATPLPRIYAPEVNIPRYDVDIFLDSWALWGIAGLLLDGIGIANVRDYIAVVFATVGVARFIAKPPQVPHKPATRVVIEKK